VKCAFAAAFAASGIITTVAFASPPSNFTGEGLVAADLDKLVNISSEGGSIKFQTTHRTDTAVVKLTFGANGDSGWHHHPGMVLVQVQSGSVTLKNGSCGSTTYGPGLPNGSVFVEGQQVHDVTSSAGAVAYATAIVKNADPKVFRIEDSAPACNSLRVNR
jgi:quercetin dioxygenase-like cupin family protein